MTNHVFRGETADQLLPELTWSLLRDGIEMGSRLGERVQELTQVSIALDQPWKREILNQDRKASIAAQIAETMWVLSGRDDVGWLERYLPRARQFSDDGQVWRGAYGPRLRHWKSADGRHSVDQFKYVERLLSEDRSTRRAVLQIYNPSIDSLPGKDVPCNDWISLLNRDGALELNVAVRSNDLWWGWSGINAFEWSTMAEVLAHGLGLDMGPIHFNIASLHLYDRHWGRAERLQRIGGETLHLDEVCSASPRYAPGEAYLGVSGFDALAEAWFMMEESIYSTHKDGGDLDELRPNIEAFPEPMLRSWLKTIAYYWTQDPSWVTSDDQDKRPTRLAAAARISPKPRHQVKTGDRLGSMERVSRPNLDEFGRYVAGLHSEKNAVYGNSWRKRGEALSILANVARKVDRIGEAGAGDTATDTAVDLLVYLIKYRIWLEHPGNRDLADDDQAVEEYLEDQAWKANGPLETDRETTQSQIRQMFDGMLDGLYGRPDGSSDPHVVQLKLDYVRWLLKMTYALAEQLWVEENKQQSRPVSNETRMWNPQHGLSDEELY